MSLLSTHGLTAFYGDAQALFGIDFELGAGELVAIIGANGAGKSTFMKSVTGLVRAAREQVRFDGQPIGGLPPGRDCARHRAGARGAAPVPEPERRGEPVDGRLCRSPRPLDAAATVQAVPDPGAKRALPGTSLSGGQQQMVAIGRALMSNPTLLLCDELSLGLAPIVIKEIYDAMPAICAEGMTVVIVEQDVSTAMRVAQRIYCFQEGRVSLQGASDQLTRDEISAAYFGV